MQVRQALRSDRNTTLETAQGRIFVEVFSPLRRCFVVGAVHIAQPLVQMLKLADYGVIVIDPRGSFATEARFPGVELTQEWPDEALERLKPDHRSAVVTLTHDPKLDDPALAVALRSDCFYVGALGSRRTHAARCSRLTETGLRHERARPDPRADRLGDRRGVAGRGRDLDRGADDPDPASGRKGGGGMKFGEVPVGEAEGAILAHSLRLGTAALKKARVLSRADLDLIAGAGLSRIVVARLEPGDVGEDEAARTVAAAVAGDGVEAAAPFTGRANLFARARGLLVFDRERLDRLNLVDEAITLGTLPPFAVVEPRMMVATVKIIPFAAPAEAVERCVAAARSEGPLLRVAPFVPRSVGLDPDPASGIEGKHPRQDPRGHRGKAQGTRLPAGRRGTLRPRGLRNSTPLIRDAIGHGVDILLIHGASAILDRRDVIPAAIVAAGGRIDHFGMPVDPGNLLLLGHVGERAVLGLPGCARSPKVNGFDWVLERLVAGLPVGPGEIMRMGSGGLLAEIPSRPLPRAEATPATEAEG